MKKGIKLVHGVGVNDAAYNTCSPTRCKYYTKWVDMLMRCYSEKYQMKNKRYIGCTVCDEWLIFSNFKAWMEKQEWKGKELDKDLLVKDNKIYSPDACCFLERRINAFIVGNINDSGSYWNGYAKKFQASCRNPFTKRSENLGLFVSDREAKDAWKSKKLEHAIALAGYINEEKIAKALISRYL